MGNHGQYHESHNQKQQVQVSNSSPARKPTFWTTGCMAVTTKVEERTWKRWVWYRVWGPNAETTFLKDLGRIQFSPVVQLCPTLWDSMNCSTPGYPVHHQLPELAQTHVHQVGDAIQPSHPLSSPSPPAFNLPQHQGLFQWVRDSLSLSICLRLGLFISP